MRAFVPRSIGEHPARLAATFRAIARSVERLLQDGCPTRRHAGLPRDNHPRAQADAKLEMPNLLTLRAARFMPDSDARKLKSLSDQAGCACRDDQIFPGPS